MLTALTSTKDIPYDRKKTAGRRGFFRQSITIYIQTVTANLITERHRIVQAINWLR